MRAIVFKDEHDIWVAHGLDYDIAAQGNDADDAERLLRQAVAAQCQLDRGRGREPLQGFTPAPDGVWKMRNATRAFGILLT